MVQNDWRRTWLDEESGSNYGDLLHKRATGELPEMQSSIAVAKRLSGSVRAGNRILDVGCGSGHYLVSLRNRISCPFEYVGVDATAQYVERARRAFPGIRFVQGDIFDLPFPDAEFDVVMCNNVLLHLPSIKEPLRQLVRVAKRQVIVRTLIGDRSFEVKACDEETAENFSDDGSLQKFHYFNIYSEEVVRGLLAEIPEVESSTIELDRDFDPVAIEAARKHSNKANATSLVGGWQVNGYILEPWAFLTISKSEQS